jgi:hypothetical protein
VGIYDFKIGDILYDTVSKDIGILISRVDSGSVIPEHDFYLWVWEIYWTRELHQFYSEDSLEIMVTSERLIHFGSL